MVVFWSIFNLICTYACVVVQRRGGAGGGVRGGTTAWRCQSRSLVHDARSTTQGGRPVALARRPRSSTQLPHRRRRRRRPGDASTCSSSSTQWRRQPDVVCLRSAGANRLTVASPAVGLWNKCPISTVRTVATLASSYNCDSSSYNWDSTPIWPQSDCAKTVRRPALRPLCGLLRLFIIPPPP